MRIGALARKTGISERALRYYEEQGLLRPQRLPSGYRDYPDSAVTTVGQIRDLLAAGLPTKLIAEVLPCMVRAGTVLAPACPELLPALTEERDRISAAIDKLRDTRDLLDAVIGAAPPAPVVAQLCPS